MTTPLVPVVNSAKATVAVADAPAFLADLFNLTALPTGKAATDLTNYTVNRKTDGSLIIIANFKNS